MLERSREPFAKLEVDRSIIVKVELGAEAPARGLMRPIHFACACLASALLLEACSGGSSALPTSIASKPAAHTIAAGLAGPDACPASRIYVADFAKSDVEIYPQ